MYASLSDYEITKNDINETLEGARQDAIKDLNKNPATTRKKYVVQILEVLGNDIEVPPVKNIDISTINDPKQVKNILAAIMSDDE